MEKGYRRGEGVLLLDWWDEAATKLWISFRKAGFEGPVIVVHDQGFLPDDVISVCRWFCERQGLGEGGAKDGRCEKVRARFFNEIERPDFWEITSGSSGGEVRDKNHLRGRIFFSAPSNRRLARRVDWLDESETVRFSDHYDAAGRLYARSTYDGSGNKIQMTWFDKDGVERLTENMVTRDLILNSDGKMRIIRNRTELVILLFEKMDIKGERIFYNSLSTPFFVSERLLSTGRKHLLFWQEPPREDIPGNMLGILNGTSGTEKVLVQNAESFSKLKEHGANAARLQLFGYLYPYSREDTYGREILICTNSDMIEALQELVTDLPDMRFSIAAVTEMSAKLLAMGRFSNVSLYPCAKADTLRALYDRCDYYLDINYGKEIMSAVKEAYLHNQLILAFPRTIHDPTYTAGENIASSIDNMEEIIRKCASDRQEMDRRLTLQKKAALDEPAAAYQKLIR